MKEETTESRGAEPDEHISLYLRTLKDKNPALRSCAARELGRTGSQTVLDPLLRALEDEDCWVRQHVVEALGRIKDPRAIPYLESLLTDKASSPWSNRTIAEVAKEAIKMIRGGGKAA